MFNPISEGVPEDDKEAVKWYRLAAEQGHAKAQFNLHFSSNHPISGLKISTAISPNTTDEINSAITLMYPF